MPALQWNIFARELVTILAHYNWTLGYLDDRGVVHNREKVRRLQKSLDLPVHLATLNPEELERLFIAVPVNLQDQKRLRAALLATAVEMMLMDRLKKDTALMVSDNVFELLMKADDFSAVKGAFIDDAVDEGLVGHVETLIERANLAMHIARLAPTTRSQLINAEDAIDIVERILDLLKASMSQERAGPGGDEAQLKPEDRLHWQEDALDIQRQARETIQKIQKRGENP